MTWGWVDDVDAKSIAEYDWKGDNPGMGVLESAVDIIGDKLLEADFWVVVGFIQRGFSGPFNYNLATKVVTKAQ